MTFDFIVFSIFCTKCSYKKRIEFADSITSIDRISKNRFSTVGAENIVKWCSLIIHLKLTLSEFNTTINNTHRKTIN